jgi:hypothetical protein
LFSVWRLGGVEISPLLVNDVPIDRRDSPQGLKRRRDSTRLYASQFLEVCPRIEPFFFLCFFHLFSSAFRHFEPQRAKRLTHVIAHFVTLVFGFPLSPPEPLPLPQSPNVSREPPSARETAEAAASRAGYYPRPRLGLCKPSNVRSLLLPRQWFATDSVGSTDCLTLPTIPRSTMQPGHRISSRGARRLLAR